MRNLFIVALLLVVAQVHGKWTLVPRFSSYISIVAQGDTLDAISSNTTLYKDEQDGMFRCAVIHETMTVDRIRYIRRQENRAALFTVSAVLSGVSAFSSDWRQRYRGRTLAYMDATLASVYQQNADAAKKLEIEAWIENTSSEEIMLADQDRGTVWFLQPGQDIRFKMQNPDVMQLRISTTDNRVRHFVTICAGNFLRNANVEYENDEYYIFPVTTTDDDGDIYIDRYAVMDKKTADIREISKKEMKQLKKQK